MRALTSPKLILLASACLVGLVGCPSAKQTCEHYRDKDFNPMPKNAIEACTKVCEKGDEEACELLEHWRREGEQRRVAEAVWAEISGEVHCPDGACEQACRLRDDPLACLELGLRHHYGLAGFSVDLDAAARAYARGCGRYDDSRSCDFDFRLAHDRMGRYEDLHDFWDGRCPGEPGDDLQRFAADCVAVCLGRQACDHWLQLRCETDLGACENACDEGDAAYCRQLFLMQREGRGMVQNQAQAEARRKRACELGDPFSCDAGKGRFSVTSRKLAPKSL